MAFKVFRRNLRSHFSIRKTPCGNSSSVDYSRVCRQSRYLLLGYLFLKIFFTVFLVLFLVLMIQSIYNSIVETIDLNYGFKFKTKSAL